MAIFLVFRVFRDPSPDSRIRNGFGLVRKRWPVTATEKECLNTAFWSPGKLAFT